MSPEMNSLLADLPAKEYDALTAGMKLVSLRKGETLFNIGQTPQHVYYPVGAIVSMICELGNGYSVETYMLGKTCMVGVAALNKPSFYKARVRSAGFAYKLPTPNLLSLRTSSPGYMFRAQKAWLNMTQHLSQGIVCAKHHTVMQQLIKWILVTLDRSLDTTIDITHKELAELLGFRREAVSLTMSHLSELEFITQHRGGFVVNHRAGLENLSCECYWITSERKRPNILSLSDDRVFA